MKRLLSLILIAAAALAQQTVTLTSVAPPGVVVSTAVSGTPGTTLACYWVVTNYVGGAVLSAAPACLPNVPNSLSSMNEVLINWPAASGASITYDVLKTTTPTPPLPGASVSLATGLTTTTSSDQGGSLSAYTIATFPYATSSAIVRLNSQDYTVPTFEYIAPVAQGAFGIEVPKAGGVGALRLGSRATPFTIDSTGAAFLTSGSTAPGSALGTVTAGVVVSTSVNLTLAQVNAGTVIVPAVTGQTYKLQHVVLQALGGNTAGCTLVEVADTAGSPVVGISAAIAALTQNTIVNEATASGVTVTTIAPTALTAAKGIQVLKTGSACTTATSFNVIVFYTINS